MGKNIPAGSDIDGCGILGLSIKKLGCPVPKGHNILRQIHDLMLVLPRKPKIANFNFSIFVKQQVATLHISVNNLLRMDVVHPFK